MNIFKTLLNAVLFAAIFLNLGSGYCCFSSTFSPIGNNLNLDKHHETANSHEDDVDCNISQNKNIHKSCCVEVKVNDENGYIAEGIKVFNFEPCKIPLAPTLYIDYLNKFILNGFDSDVFPPKQNCDNLNKQFSFRSNSSNQFTDTIRLLI